MKNKQLYFDAVLGKMLAKQRHEKGITQIQMAKATGIPQTRLSRLENGLIKIRLVESIDIAEHLGMTNRWLFSLMGKATMKIKMEIDV